MILAGMRHVQAEHLSRGDRAAVGFGETEVASPKSAASPWAVALVTSVVGAVTGWVVEETAKAVRKRRRRR